MIRLPYTGTYSLELVTAQNGAKAFVSFSDASSSAYDGGSQVTSITSATTTTICATPAASTVRDIDQINIKNTYNGTHLITVQVDANGTNYPLMTVSLSVDESVNYTHGSGWQVLDASGNVKTSGGSSNSSSSANLTYISTNATIPKGSYLVDTSAGAITLTLSASPVQGDAYEFVDAKGTWGTNNLTVARNGHNMIDSGGASVAEDFIADLDGLQFTLFYDSPNWRPV